MVCRRLSEKVSLFAVPVFFGRAAETCSEDPVKVADVFIADCTGDLVNFAVGVFEKPGCLGKPLFLNQFRIILSGLLTDQA